jgi:hypothetical protein
VAKPTLHFQRFEFKYFLPRHQARPLIAALRPYTVRDPFAASPDGSYRVNSLYFDTPDYDTFWDKEAGLADRKKLRLRYYGERLGPEVPVFVEIKRKHFELVIKDRVSVKPDEVRGVRLQREFRELAKNGSNADFAGELSWFMNRNSLRPKIFIAYKRTALLSRRNKEFRVTIDEDIIAREQFSLDRTASRKADIYRGGVVVEVKYENVLPAWFHRILQKFELQRLAFSKYGNSVRHLIPALDDNNYKPI